MALAQRMSQFAKYHLCLTFSTLPVDGVAERHRGRLDPLFLELGDGTRPVLEGCSRSVGNVFWRCIFGLPINDTARYSQAAHQPLQFYAVMFRREADQ